MPRLFLSLILMLGLSACSRPQLDGEGPLVITSTSVLADIVSQMAPDDLRVHPLIPAGVDPHGFEPGPRELGALTGAALIITTGGDLSPQLLHQLSAVCPKAEIMILGGEQHHAHDHGAGEHDPHVWLNPATVRSWLPSIAARLREFGDGVQAGAYDRQLAQVDAEVRTVLASIPESRRALVMDHDCMSHFCEAYGFTTAAVLVEGTSTLSAPSARHIATVQSLILDQQLPALFITSEEHRPLAERIGSDLKVAVYRLHVDALDMENGPASYLDMLSTNAAVLRMALTEGTP